MDAVEGQRRGLGDEEQPREGAYGRPSPRACISLSPQGRGSGRGLAAEMKQPLDADELRLIDAYWRAANYISVGQIYLLNNPLLTRPLSLDDIKPRLLGHWGTTPGLNLIYAHANRVIKDRDLDAIYIMGPGPRGPAAVANAHLEGTHSEVYPDITKDAAGIQKLVPQVFCPRGSPD